MARLQGLQAGERPADADRRKISATGRGVTGSEAETEALLASLHTLEIQHAEWQRQLRTGLRPHQHQLAELDARTSSFRVFEPATIPGLLQTAEYARARFARERHCSSGTRTTSTMPSGPACSVRRLLYRPRQALPFRADRGHAAVPASSPEVHARPARPADVIVGAAERRLGIIGFETAFVVGAVAWLLAADRNRVMVETFSAELNLAQPQEIELYAASSTRWPPWPVMAGQRGDRDPLSSMTLRQR